MAWIAASEALRVGHVLARPGRPAASRPSRPAGPAAGSGRTRRRARGWRARQASGARRSRPRARPRRARRPCGRARGRRRDLEVLVRVDAQDLLGGGDLGLAEGRAVRLAGVLQVRRRPADDGAQPDDGGALGLGLGAEQRLVQRLDVLVVLAVGEPVHVLHVPAVGLVALAARPRRRPPWCRPRSRCGCRRRSRRGCRASAWPAIEDASEVTPSSRSPSEAKT